MKIHKQEDS